MALKINKLPINFSVGNNKVTIHYTQEEKPGELGFSSYLV
jgi:hypothetical protein